MINNLASQPQAVLSNKVNPDRDKRCEVKQIESSYFTAAATVRKPQHSSHSFGKLLLAITATLSAIITKKEPVIIKHQFVNELNPGDPSYTSNRHITLSSGNELEESSQPITHQLVKNDYAYEFWQFINENEKLCAQHLKHKFSIVNSYGRSYSLEEYLNTLQHAATPVSTDTTKLDYFKSMACYLGYKHFNWNNDEKAVPKFKLYTTPSCSRGIIADYDPDDRTINLNSACLAMEHALGHYITEKAISEELFHYQQHRNSGLALPIILHTITPINPNELKNCVNWLLNNLDVVVSPYLTRRIIETGTLVDLIYTDNRVIDWLGQVVLHYYSGLSQFLLQKDMDGMLHGLHQATNSKGAKELFKEFIKNLDYNFAIFYTQNSRGDKEFLAIEFEAKMLTFFSKLGIYDEWRKHIKCPNLFQDAIVKIPPP